MLWRIVTSLSLVASLLIPTATQADDKGKRKRKARAAAAEQVEPAEADPAEAEAAPSAPPGLNVQTGPLDGKLSNIASVKIPDGVGFVAQKDMPMLNKLTGNLDNPKDVGAVLGDDGWIVFFTWDPVGYVSDAEKDELDAEELLDTFKDAEAPGNEARAAQGFEPLYIVGWQTEPYYDQRTNNLTWALKNKIGNQERFNINHEVRLLGRRGYMSATLVADPDKLEATLPKLDTLLDGFSFESGQLYGEYIKGDKLAAYGLTGLVLGGGALLAAKTGLLGQLGKFFKFIVLGAIAIVGGAFKWFKSRLRGEV